MKSFAETLSVFLGGDGEITPEIEEVGQLLLTLCGKFGLEIDVSENSFHLKPVPGLPPCGFRVEIPSEGIKLRTTRRHTKSPYANWFVRQHEPRKVVIHNRDNDDERFEIVVPEEWKEWSWCKTEEGVLIRDTTNRLKQ